MKTIVKFFITLIYAFCWLIIYSVVLGLSFTITVFLWCNTNEKNTFIKFFKEEYNNWVDVFPKPNKLWSEFK
jgi:hypothetical protein